MKVLQNEWLKTKILCSSKEKTRAQGARGFRFITKPRMEKNASYIVIKDNFFGKDGKIDILVDEIES